MRTMCGMATTKDPEMRDSEQPTGGSRAATYEVARSAAAVNLVMLVAIPTAGMIFGADHLAAVTLALLWLSIAAWAGVASILELRRSISRIRRSGLTPPDDP